MMEDLKDNNQVELTEEMPVQTETFEDILEKVEISTYLCHTCTLEYMRKIRQTAEKQNKPKRNKK